MAINIENRDIEQSIERLRALTGKDAAELIGELVAAEIEKQEKLKGIEAARPRDVAERRARIKVLSAAYRASLKGPIRAHEDLIGYDENGLPT